MIVNTQRFLLIQTRLLYCRGLDAAHQDNAIKNYNPTNITPSSREDFKQIANGVFQSEGTESAHIKKGDKLIVNPVVTLGQNYTPSGVRPVPWHGRPLGGESLKFPSGPSRDLSESPAVKARGDFVRFYSEIGQVGKIRLVTSLSGKVYIRWITESWKDILGTLVNYFSGIYGEKYIAFRKLATIYALKSQPDEESRIEVIKLIYSLAKTGVERKITLLEKFAEFGLPSDNDPDPKGVYLDNPSIPSFLFLFGLNLGDGSIFIRIRQTTGGSLNFIPNLTFAQKTTEQNKHIFNMLATFFTNIGINPVILNKKDGMTFFNIEGVKAISLLVPMFNKNTSYSYWKSENINLLIEFFKRHSAGIHTYREGTIALLETMYKYPNKRDKSLDEWVKLANEYFDKLEAGILSGYQLIQSQTGRGDLANEQIAWKVVFPEKLKIQPKLSLKYFHFSTYGTKEKALQAAVSYRNSVLEKHLEEFL
jgi:hypothetical protein